MFRLHSSFAWWSIDSSLHAWQVFTFQDKEALTSAFWSGQQTKFLAKKILKQRNWIGGPRMSSKKKKLYEIQAIGPQPLRQLHPQPHESYLRHHLRWCLWLVPRSTLPTSRTAVDLCSTRANKQELRHCHHHKTKSSPRQDRSMRAWAAPFLMAVCFGRL